MIITEMPAEISMNSHIITGKNIYPSEVEVGVLELEKEDVEDNDHLEYDDHLVDWWINWIIDERSTKERIIF